MLIVDMLKENSRFSYVETLLADFFLKQGVQIEEMSARSVAKEVHTAPSTITRFAMKLGFDGYPEFKKAYLKELTYLNRDADTVDANYPFKRTDKNTVIAEKIGALYGDIIDDNLSLIEHDSLQKAINMIDAAEHIYIVSGGVQNEIAKAFQNKMLKIGKNVIIDVQLDNPFYRASYGGKKDCFVLISYSGELDTTLRVARKVHERKIPSIAITTIGGNTLSQLVDVSLFVSSKETLVDNLGNFSMNLSTMMWLDILYVSHFNQHYEEHLDTKKCISHEYEVRRSSKISLLRNGVPEKEKE